MINANIDNIDFIAANTDGQALSRSMAKTQIQLGKELTNGLGAGSDYTIGEQAALETIDEIMMELEDVNMLFIATGMGGGTGTGAAPIIAQKAKERGILTIAVVTKPFDFEGNPFTIGRSKSDFFTVKLNARPEKLPTNASPMPQTSSP